MNSIKLKNIMDIILMNFDPHGLLLSLSDKTNLKRKDKCVALSNLQTLAFTIHGKI